jgi:zinc D-Ala-D-Ala carboxypeptidase
MRLSPNFTLDQLIRSGTAARLSIDNRPGPEELANLRRLAGALDAVLALLGRPLSINSGYRCAALNAAVGGAPGSRHTMGLAADFTCAAFGDPLAVARAIAETALPFDQLIHEYGRWVHLGLAPVATDTRRQTLTICSAATGYVDGLHECAVADSNNPARRR